MYYRGRKVADSAEKKEADAQAQETHLLIFATGENTTKNAAQFLNRRGVKTIFTSSLHEAVEVISSGQANIILMSVNISHPKVEAIPHLFKQNYGVNVIVFGEQHDRKTSQLMAATKCRHTIFGVPSGPTVMMRIRAIEKEKQQEDNAGSEEERQKRQSQGSAAKEDQAIKISGSNKNNDMMTFSSDRPKDDIKAKFFDGLNSAPGSMGGSMGQAQGVHQGGNSANAQGFGQNPSGYMGGSGPSNNANMGQQTGAGPGSPEFMGQSGSANAPFNNAANSQMGSAMTDPAMQRNGAVNSPFNNAANSQMGSAMVDPAAQRNSAANAGGNAYQMGAMSGPDSEASERTPSGMERSSAPPRVHERDAPPREGSAPLTHGAEEEPTRPPRSPTANLNEGQKRKIFNQCAERAMDEATEPNPKERNRQPRKQTLKIELQKLVVLQCRSKTLTGTIAIATGRNSTGIEFSAEFLRDKLMYHLSQYGMFIDLDELEMVHLCPKNFLSETLAAADIVVTSQNPNLEVVMALLSGEDVSFTAKKQIRDMWEVPLQVFAQRYIVPTSVYLHIQGPDRFLKYLEAGTRMSARQLSRFQYNNVPGLYVKDTEIKDFTPYGIKAHLSEVLEKLRQRKKN